MYAEVVRVDDWSTKPLPSSVLVTASTAFYEARFDVSIMIERRRGAYPVNQALFQRRCDGLHNEFSVDDRNEDKGPKESRQVDSRVDFLEGCNIS
jgi:hypothetical protein